jgi:hypothetical protein
MRIDRVDDAWEEFGIDNEINQTEYNSVDYPEREKTCRGACCLLEEEVQASGSESLVMWFSPMIRIRWSSKSDFGVIARFNVGPLEMIGMWQRNQVSISHIIYT